MGQKGLISFISNVCTSKRRFLGPGYFMSLRRDVALRENVEENLQLLSEAEWRENTTVGI